MKYALGAVLPGAPVTVAGFSIQHRLRSQPETTVDGISAQNVTTSSLLVDRAVPVFLFCVKFLSCVQIVRGELERFLWEKRV